MICEQDEPRGDLEGSNCPPFQARCFSDFLEFMVNLNMIIELVLEMEGSILIEGLDPLLTPQM